VKYVREASIFSHTETVLVFSDAATSSKMNVAIGAFICLGQNEIQHYIQYSLDELYFNLHNVITYQHYKSNKSTWSEIKTVIAALNYIEKNLSSIQHVIIYTDCQSLCDLLGKRKAKLLQNNFITRHGKRLQNADLYQELYHIAEKFQIETIKIKGHQSKAMRMTVQEKIFTILDNLSRKKLRSCQT
jgi:ribonuclease HI